jgi:hypothetical protein
VSVAEPARCSHPNGERCLRSALDEFCGLFARVGRMHGAASQDDEPLSFVRQGTFGLHAFGGFPGALRVSIHERGLRFA